MSIFPPATGSLLCVLKTTGTHIVGVGDECHAYLYSSFPSKYKVPYVYTAPNGVQGLRRYFLSISLVFLSRTPVFPFFYPFGQQRGPLIQVSKKWQIK